MFKENKYTKIYFSIIENRKSNPITDGIYAEKHHIIPKSLGGGEGDNLVKLTAREHFICHYLLTKMTRGSHWESMIVAFNFMNSESNNQCRYMNSRLYESNRIDFAKIQSKRQSGSNNSHYGMRWVTDFNELSTRQVPIDYKNSGSEVSGRFLMFINKGWDVNFLKELYEGFITQPYSITSYIKSNNILTKLHGNTVSNLTKVWVDLGIGDTVELDLRNKVSHNTETTISKYKDKAEDLFTMFKDGDFKSVMEFYRVLTEQHGYTKSNQSLFNAFLTHIPEYKMAVNRGHSISSQTFK